MRSKPKDGAVRFALHMLLFSGVFVGSSLPAGAGGALPSREEVLRAAYGIATPRAERLFLTDAQRDEAERQAGARIPSLLVGRYILVRDGRPVGRAYVDTHVVRSKKESLLICLDEAGRVLRVEATAFQEPLEYLAPDAWYRQFEGKDRIEELSLNRAIRPLAGATLTARAAAEAVRRVLAIDRVVSPAREEEK